MFTGEQSCRSTKTNGAEIALIIAGHMSRGDWTARCECVSQRNPGWWLYEKSFLLMILAQEILHRCCISAPTEVTSVSEGHYWLIDSLVKERAITSGSPNTCCPSRGMNMWGFAVGGLSCGPCFQHCSSFCCSSRRSRSLSTLLWPSLSLSRFCWYSSSCSSSSTRSRLNLSAATWHCLSLSSSMLSCAPCWLFLAWHSRSQRSFSWRRRSWSRWATAASSFCFSRLRCFSWSWRALPRTLGRCSRWARGEGRPLSWRRSLWTS